jgi:hypothetical protein
MMFLGAGIMYGVNRIQSQSVIGGGIDATAPTQHVFYIYDDNVRSTELTTALITPYYVDISAMTDEEIADLEYSDYTALTGFYSGLGLTPNADYTYAYKVTLSGYQTQWALAPVLGTNNIYLTNTTEDVAIACMAKETLSVTFNQTDMRDWSVIANTLDASESSTAKKTTKEGFQSYYDFENDYYVCVVARITTNATSASLSYCALSTELAHNEKVSGSYIYYEFYNLNMVGDFEFDFRLGSGLGSDFEVTTFELGYYSAIDTFTAWDSQN